MNTEIKHTTSIISRLIRFIGAILTIAFMVPAVAVSQSSPAPVNLGTSGNFVILAKTGISTTGTTHITGDMGISPAAASFITGFGLIADASNTFSTSSLVTGKVYAANYSAPTPTKLTTAVNDMETAYTDAAGRTLPDYTELYTGHLTGQTLTPGLYKWGAAVQVSASGVIISGSASDVWIFQIAQNLELASGANVTLSGGAKASNIFWQVAGQVTLGTTAAMNGIILCKTKIVMNSSATLNGRALAQTAVTLIANTVTQTAVIISPTVITTDPANLTTGVALNQKMAAIFSVPMNATTINASSFTLNQGTTSISGNVSYSGKTAIFTPTSNLIANTTYTATITTGAKDLQGNALANNYTWTFTSGAAVVIVPPTVISTDPVNSGIDVTLNKIITATFSKTMDAVTINTVTFTLMQGSSSVSGFVSYSGTTATFTPQNSLSSNTTYTATVTTGAKDLQGNALENNYIWKFTTATAVAVFEKDRVPQTFSLEQNYPNPFNPSTRIQYSLQKAGQVSLRVYDLFGHEVVTLVNNNQEAGNYTVLFNVRGAKLNLSSGVYIYRLEAGSFVSTKKLILMK